MKSASRYIGIAAASLAALATLSACGGSSDSSATAATAAPAASTSSGNPIGAQGGGHRQAFMDCMKQNGVDFPSFDPNGAPPSGMPAPGTSGFPGPGGPGGPAGPGGNDPAFAKAIEACKSLAPQGFGKRPSMDANALKAFTTCMSDNGITISDSENPFSGIDRNDPMAKAALDTCRSLLPMPGGPGGPQSGSSAPAQ